MKTAALLMLLLTMFVPLTSNAQDTNDIPYLYYYDSARRAFIIEQADGADRRILAEGLLDAVDGGYVLDGPGWSPDGQWLAFTAARPFNAQWGKRAFVINVDSQRMLTSLPAGRSASLQWSPDGQELFVISQWYADGIVTASFDIVDVNVDERLTIHEFQYAASNFNPTEYTVQWIDDAVIVEGFEFVQDNRQPVIYVFKNGQYQTRFQADNLIPGENFRTFASSTGWVAERTSSGLKMVNLLTTDQVTHPLIAWDQDYTGELRMIWNGDEGVLSAENIWYVTEDSIVELVRFHPDLRPSSRYFEWSPDGHHLFMILGELVLQFSNGLVSWLDFTVQHFLIDFNLTWIDENSAFMFVDETLRRYDFDTKETVQLAESMPGSIEPAFAVSPSGNTIGYINEGAILFDVAANQVTQFEPNPYSYSTLQGGRMEWRDDWVLIYENAFLVGSGRPYFLSVFREGDKEPRALSRIARGDPIYAGWVPIEVPVNQIPTAPLDITPQLQPEQALQGDHWSFRIVWSPDGTKIAAGLEWDTGDITIWDVDQGIPLETISQVSLDTKLRWEDGELALQNLPRQNIDFDSNDKWRVISRDGEGTYVRLYNIESSQFVCPVMGDFDNTSSASLSPDGNYLVTGHRFEVAKIWEVESCTVVATLPEPAPGVAFSPDGTQLAAGVGWDVHIYDVELLLGKPRIFG